MVDVIGGADDPNALVTVLTLDSAYIQKGVTYSFRYRVLNEKGWSGFSPETQVEAADSPSQPDAPTLVSASSTTFELEFNLGTIDNNGSQILSYRLETDGGVSGAAFTAVASYPASGTIRHTLEASDGITEGSIYKFRWGATNAVGDGLPSPEVQVAATDAFPAPANLAKVRSQSSKTSIHVTWDAVPDGILPGGEVLGYVLQVEDSNNGTTWTAFDGKAYGLPSQTQFAVYGLVTGRDYKFTVAAQGINGIGEWSDPEEVFYACLPPSGMAAPQRLTTTTSSIAVSWQAPESDGGCDVSGFAVFVDDGLGGALTEVNEAEDPLVRNIPGLSQLLITSPFATAVAGTDYRVYVEAFNADGSIISEVATITLGDVPSLPPSAPTKDQSQGSTTSLHVVLDGLSTEETQGLTILSYCLEIDRLGTATFESVAGCETASLLLSHTVTSLTTGNSYGFRYKARNAYGWGEYSEAATLLVATEPATPSFAPTFTSSTDTELTIGLSVDAVENNGSVILEFSLEVSDGLDAFAVVDSYDAVSSSHTLTVGTDGLVTGTVYNLRYRARNALGWGNYSPILLSAALIGPPAQPSLPTRLDVASDETQLAVVWDPVADEAAPGGVITGYRLYMAEGSSGQFALVYDGTGFPTIFLRVITDLTTGSLYRFKVSAFNLNGEGPLSDEMQTRACQAPAQMDAPLRVDSTMVSLTLQWEHPADNGGCPITSFAVFRDAGDGGDIDIEANAPGDTNVRNRPSLASLMITNFPVGSTGLTF